MVRNTGYKLKLLDGNEIPAIGLGVFRAADGDETYNAVRWALDAGYRHIDTAAAYRNEESVGKAIRDSGIPREEIFVTTKLATDPILERKMMEAFEESLKKLDIGYIDLYLIHWPENDVLIETWDNLQKMKATGKTKSIGVCNCKIHHLEEIIAAGGDVPVINQCECNPSFQQDELLDFCRAHNILFEAWSPLGGARHSMTGNDEIWKIAMKYGKTAAQVIIAWHLQRGEVVIPKSVHQRRIESNLDSFDFTLSNDDMAKIKALDTGVRSGPDPDERWARKK